MPRFGFGLLSLVLLCHDGNTALGQDTPHCTDADLAPDALTKTLGKHVPQTCFDVPNGDGTGALSRCYYTYIPDNAVCTEKFTTNTEEIPLVFDLHGFTACARLSAQYTGWKEQADKDCFVLVWPSGTIQDPAAGGCWNMPGGVSLQDGITTTRGFCDDDSSLDNYMESLKTPMPDDALFLRMAIDRVIEDVGADKTNNITINRSRVYMAGHSNGCFMSNAMAALHSDAIAAVCCHSGLVLTPFDAETYTNKVPIMMIFGRQDDVIPFDGFAHPGEELRLILPHMDVLEYLAKSNGCAESSEYIKWLGIEGNGRLLSTLHKRTGCDQGADVHLLHVEGSKHNPFKWEPQIKEWGKVADGTPIDTTQIAWDFCSSHTKATSPGPLSEGEL